MTVPYVNSGPHGQNSIGWRLNVVAIFVLLGGAGLAGNPIYNFMKLDIQGAEIIALKGAVETLKNVEVCLLETSNVEYNKGAPTTSTVLHFMETIGFLVFDIVELHRKGSRESPHGIMFQMDFIFVRSGSPILENAHGYWKNGGR